MHVGLLTHPLIELGVLERGGYQMNCLGIIEQDRSQSKISSYKLQDNDNALKNYPN